MNENSKLILLLILYSNSCSVATTSFCWLLVQMIKINLKWTFLDLPPISSLRPRYSRTLATDNTNLVAHIFNGHAGHLLKIFIPTVDKDSVNALVLAVHEELGEHNDVLGMASAIGDLGREVIVNENTKVCTTAKTYLGTYFCYQWVR